MGFGCIGVNGIKLHPDDISIAELERDYFEANGFDSEIIHNGAEGLEIALNVGADDYMTNPFSPGELVARVKSYISRYDRLMGSDKKPEIVSLKVCQ